MLVRDYIKKSLLLVRDDLKISLDDDCADADSLMVLIIMIMIIPPDGGEGDVGGEEEEETNEGEQGDDQGGQVKTWKIFSTDFNILKK